MIFLFLILPIVLIALVVSLLTRVLFGGFGFRHRYRGFPRQPRGSWINGTGYGDGFGYGRNFGYNRGYGRAGLRGSLLSILALVALERLFTRRY